MLNKSVVISHKSNYLLMQNSRLVICSISEMNKRGITKDFAKIGLMVIIIVFLEADLSSTLSILKIRNVNKRLSLVILH